MRFSSSAFRKVNSGSVVALGCFDGVHIGHSKIISSAVELAKEMSLESVVWSFQAPPKSFLSGQGANALTTLEEKKSLMRALGVNVFICAPFNEKIARLSPYEFFDEILVKRLNARHIFCGFNYRFGYKGGGDAELLRSLCEKAQISLTVFDEISIDNGAVSSSAIRAYLVNGEMELAERMLGRPFFLRGRVIDGQHLGRVLGFPTVNQDVPRDKMSVRSGVYLTRVKIGRTVKYGITNIGMRPTVNGTMPVCETHIFDFNGNLYGKMITVEFLRFIRGERKFDSLNELTEQIEKDVNTAKKYMELI